MTSSTNIYYSVCQSLLLILSSSVFVVMGYVLLINADNLMMTIGGICGLVFIIGICVGLYSLLMAIKKRPVIKIYKDRVEYHTLNKGWKTICFNEVELFAEIKLSGVRVIQAHFLNNLFRPDESLNTGLIANKKKVCEILNSKLKDYESGR